MLSLSRRYGAKRAIRFRRHLFSPEFIAEFIANYGKVVGRIADINVLNAEELQCMSRKGSQ
jgi:hypothetical protein